LKEIESRRFTVVILKPFSVYIKERASTGIKSWRLSLCFWCSFDVIVLLYDMEELWPLIFTWEEDCCRRSIPFGNNPDLSLQESVRRTVKDWRHSI
jgi:hypothetical protein